MIARNLIAPLLSVSLALPCIALPSRAEAAVLAAHATRAETIVTSVLGLRSDDKQAGKQLTEALRTAFAERDMSGGEELSLEEVILTLDCSSEEDTACMTEAGRALSMERLVYGTLTQGGDGFVLDIIVLDVTGGQIDAQATMPLASDATSDANVDTTAREVVESLYPSDDGPIVATTPDVERDVSDEGDDDVAEEKRGGLLWGPYKPRPTWKKVGLGVSVALTVAGIAGGVGTWVYGSNNFEKVARRIPPQQEATRYCDDILANSDDLTDDQVQDAYNCRSATRAQTWNRVSVGVAIAGGVGTIAFTILHFVHKDRREAAERANKPSFRFLAGPTTSGGMVGGAGRF